MALSYKLSPCSVFTAYSSILPRYTKLVLRVPVSDDTVLNAHFKIMYIKTHNNDNNNNNSTNPIETSRCTFFPFFSCARWRARSIESLEWNLIHFGKGQTVAIESKNKCAKAWLVRINVVIDICIFNLPLVKSPSVEKRKQQRKRLRVSGSCYGSVVVV